MRKIEIIIIIILIFAGIFVAYNYVFSPADNISVPAKNDSGNLTGSQTAENSNVPAQEQKLWGAYVAPSSGSVFSFEQMIGKRPDMLAVFISWDEEFPNDFALSSGQTLVIFWEQYEVSLDEIISGKSDSYISRFAKYAKAYNSPVIIAPFHEMNGDWSPWSGAYGNNTPEKFILAWKHVYDIFDNVKDDNIKWAWVVNHESVPDTVVNAIESYYPGDGYADYVGIDGFNFGDPWETYDEIFSLALDKIKKYNKPIYIFSMASAEGLRKDDWIKDALTKIKSDPNIKGFIWFNENKEKNWLINSDPNSLQAFIQGIK